MTQQCPFNSFQCPLSQSIPQQCHLQSPWAEVRQDAKGVKWPFIICKRCVLHSRWISHHQRLIRWHCEGTICINSVAPHQKTLESHSHLFWLVSLHTTAEKVLSYSKIWDFSPVLFRFGIQNPVSASTLLNVCRGHWMSPSTTWSLSPRIQSTLWFVTTPTLWSSWACVARWEQLTLLIEPHLNLKNETLLCYY